LLQEQQGFDKNFDFEKWICINLLLIHPVEDCSIIVLYDHNCLSPKRDYKCDGHSELQLSQACQQLPQNLGTVPKTGIAV